MCRRLSEFPMPFPTLSAGRGPLFVCLAASLLALGLSGCGRRGPLEAPPDAPPPRAAPAAARQAARAAAAQPPSIVTQPGSVTLDTPEDETDEEETASSLVAPPTPTPVPRKRGRGYTIPKEPFILDPLL
jgi:predicted small lipoprotein YifL